MSWGPHVHLPVPQPAAQVSVASRVGGHLVEPLSTSSSGYPFQDSLCRGACDLRPPSSDMTHEQAPRSQGRGFPLDLGSFWPGPTSGPASLCCGACVLQADFPGAWCRAWFQEH